MFATLCFYCRRLYLTTIWRFTNVLVLHPDFEYWARRLNIEYMIEYSTRLLNIVSSSAHYILKKIELTWNSYSEGNEDDQGIRSKVLLRQNERLWEEKTKGGIWRKFLKDITTNWKNSSVLHNWNYGYEYILQQFFRTESLQNASEHSWVFKINIPSMRHGEISLL